MSIGTGRNLSPGAMRERIQFLAPTTTGNHGFATTTWAAQFTVWAAYSVQGATNETTQDRRTSKLAVDFDVRYRADITSDMRVLWRGKTFEVTDLLPEAPLGRMVVKCIEESAP